MVTVDWSQDWEAIHHFYTTEWLLCVDTNLSKYVQLIFTGSYQDKYERLITNFFAQDVDGDIENAMVCFWN